ncbi:hypothetical protein Nepgr_027495 [Nepenthes gracilis]|uniref:At3g05675-like ankyrin-like domain-containing protein n=1 Tax=Nepenthes gracilis TaxID=150966 RepID=A0AAD3TBU7_NEPGR|nr:hypothetical protein Nepgr_027495 [Nepenthes gracilis]
MEVISEQNECGCFTPDFDDATQVFEITSLLFLCLMENAANEIGPSCRIGDRPTSDVVVRLRTPDGRDDWLYCHSSILIRKSKYFADRLSENWPTCQILDARNCVEVHCQESDFDYYVTLLRLLYVISDSSIIESLHGVRNALGILQVAAQLGCPQIVTSCVEYLEAVPWEEAEEEEILKTIPSMGSLAKPILNRLQPVDAAAVVRLFLLAVQFATSSPPPCLSDLKSSTQEQLEYMLTEDDDAPLLPAHGEIKLEVRECVKRLLSRFNNLLESLVSPEPKKPVVKAEKFELLQTYLSDLSWACQILGKLEIMRDLVIAWTEASETIVKIIKQESSNAEMLVVSLKVIEVAAKVLEAIGFGNVVLPPAKRLQMVAVWLPFVRVTRPLYDAALNGGGEDDALAGLESEVWQSLESAFVSMILALPSRCQADILTEWLGNQHMQYPDLTEAFEVWCYRTKVAKKRMASFSTSLV